MATNINKVGKIVLYIFLAITVLISLFPLIYAFLGSFKGTVEFLSGGSNIIPQNWDVSNYEKAWNGADFATYTGNTLFISIVSVIFTLAIGSMSAYALARGTFKVNSFIIKVLGLVMFVPGVVLIYPIFKLCNRLNLTGTIWSIVITQTAIGLPFLVILMWSYIVGISKEIDEAAKIDGSGFFGIYLHFIMPLSKPILATAGLLAFKNAWNSYLLPLALSLSNKSIRPLTVGILALKDVGEGISAWNIMIAGSVIALFPMIVVYLISNKYFIAGITDGAVKG